MFPQWSYSNPGGPVVYLGVSYRYFEHSIAMLVEEHLSLDKWVLSRVSAAERQHNPC